MSSVDGASAAGGPPALAPPPVQPPVGYVGLATRAVAGAIDAGIINVLATIAAFGVSLIVAILHFPKPLRTLIAAIGAGLYVLWILGYFIGFWSSATGQTPGNRVMQIRVVTVKGEKLKPRRALLRCFGVLAAALPLFAGFFLILFDRRRRGLQDRIAGTLVIEAPDLSIAEQRRAQMRQERTVARTAAEKLETEAPDAPHGEAGRSPDSGDAPAMPQRHG